jgi:hypothetical protein
VCCLIKLGESERSGSDGTTSVTTPGKTGVTKSKKTTNGKRAKPTVRKSAKKSRGSKFDEVVPSAVTLPATTNKWGAPNMSRKFRDMKLYVFPSFDRCDSLLFFPSTMARCLNTGDMRSLAQLMHAHLDKTCAIRMSPKHNFPVNGLAFLRLFEIMNDAHPDSIMCVHTTKVVENEIRATMYFKLTDCQTIYKSVAGTVRDPIFVPMFKQQRSARFIDNMDLTFKSDEEQSQLCAVVDSGVDLLVYGRVELSLRYDGTSKKVKEIDFMGQYTQLATTKIAAGDDDSDDSLHSSAVAAVPRILNRTQGQECNDGEY